MSPEACTTAGGAAPPTIRGLGSLRIHARLLRAPLRCFDEVAARYGPICTVVTPFRPHRRRVVLALGPEGNRRVLADPESFRTTGQGLSGPRGSALRRVRNGLTRTRGEKHRRIRALLMPSLQRHSVAAVAPEVARIVAEQLDAWSPGDRIDLAAAMRALSLRISSEVLFGIRDRERAAGIGALLGAFVRRSFSPVVLGTRIYGRVPGSPYDRLHRDAERIEREVAALIAERRRALGDDVISGLVRAHDRGVDWLREEDLVGQVTLLFGASYETTAQALLWTAVLLAQHPSVACSLRDEVSAGGGAGRYEALDALPLLDAVVKESLRLFPPVPYTIRIATRDGEVLGADVRRGDRILVSHFFTHRQASAFPEPSRFAPERWKDATPGPYEYLPFSVPPRICIGGLFSGGVLKRTIAELVRRFDFSIPEGTRIDPVVRVTLGPRRGVPMQLGRPDGAFRAARLRGDFAELVR